MLQSIHQQMLRILSRRTSGLCPPSAAAAGVASTTTTAIQPNNSRRSFSTTVNESEVQKFAALSESWWDPRENPLIHMNVTRVRYIRDQVQRHLPQKKSPVAENQQQQQQQRQSPPPPPLAGLRALDVGCGGGLLSESLARLGARTVVGLEPSPALAGAAGAHADRTLPRAARARLRYVTGTTVEELADECNAGSSSAETGDNQLFDIVCCLEVIEHVPNPGSLLEAASRLLRPDGGLLFVSTVNRTPQSFALTIVGAEYLMRYLPVGTHDWKAYKSPDEVEQLLQRQQTGVQPVDVTGMVLPPASLPAVLLRNEWNWQLDPNDTNVNWIGCYQKNKAAKI